LGQKPKSGHPSALSVADLIADKRWNEYSSCLNVM
jgi:hypothetical protein